MDRGDNLRAAIPFYLLALLMASPAVAWPPSKGADAVADATSDAATETSAANISIDRSRTTNSTWSDAEVAAAIEGMDIEAAKNCAAASGLEIKQSAVLVDLNHDGIDEIEVGTSSETQDGAGFGICYGAVGRETAILVSDQTGGWHQHFSGFEAGGFQSFDTDHTDFPLISPAEQGLCVTLYQWDGESSQWFLKDACDTATGRPRALTQDDERGSLVKSYSTGAHEVKPRKLSDDEVEAQLAKSREPLFIEPEAATSFTVDPWLLDLGPTHDHNGSEVTVYDLGGLIFYNKPKYKGIAPGTVLFQGRGWWNSDPRAYVEGVAFAFKKGCKAAGYRVEGGYDEYGDLVLKGAAPVWDKSGCQITGYSEASPNAELRFSVFADE